MSKVMKNFFLFSFILFPTLVQAESVVSFKGDFRFRNEQVKEEQVSPLAEANQFRQRLRVRLGVTAKVNENTDVIARFATGSTSSSEGNTTNQTMTDYYSKKAITLDTAYFNHKASENLQIWGGKTPLVFFNTQSDLIWDADLTPEGLAFKYKNSSEVADVFVNAGASWLAERFSATGATDNTDVGLVGAQLGVTKKIDDYSVTLAVASYNFSNIKGATAPSAKGNTLTGAVYTNEYKLTVVDLEIGATILEVPTVLYFEGVSNSEGQDYKNGGNVGIRFGKLKDPNSWAVGVDHREVEKDATVGILAESDSSGGGTDIRSNRLVIGYQAAESANVMLTLFAGQRLISSNTFTPNYSRAQFDFNFMF